MRKRLRDPPVYRPTQAEMADFASYVEKIHKEAAEFGICKVVPPKTWDAPPKEPPADSFLIRGAISQHVVGSHGVYSLMHQPRKQGISFDQFAKQAETYAARENVPASASLDALEDKFWSELIGARPPLYGADLDASLFSPELAEWNLNLLNDLLRQGSARLRQKMAGINTPMLYCGAFRTLFSLHIEDMDLFSINYMHWGEPKQWYGVPARSATLVEMVAAQSLGEQHKECEHFLRHKTTLLSPEVLQANGVPCCSLRQHAGEFVITFPKCYHFGFNFGLNCAESTNFALPSWLPLGRVATRCTCKHGEGQAKIDMARFDEQGYDDESGRASSSGGSRGMAGVSWTCGEGGKNSGKRKLIDPGRAGMQCGTPGYSSKSEPPAIAPTPDKRSPQGVAAANGAAASSSVARPAPGSGAKAKSKSAEPAAAAPAEEEDDEDDEDEDDKAEGDTRKSLVISKAMLNRLPPNPYVPFPDVERRQTGYSNLGRGRVLGVGGETLKDGDEDGVALALAAGGASMAGPFAAHDDEEELMDVGEMTVLPQSLSAAVAAAHVVTAAAAAADRSRAGAVKRPVAPPRGPGVQRVKSEALEKAEAAEEADEEAEDESSAATTSVRPCAACQGSHRKHTCGLARDVIKSNKQRVVDHGGSSGTADRKRKEASPLPAGGGGRASVGDESSAIKRAKAPKANNGHGAGSESHEPRAAPSAGRGVRGRGSGRGRALARGRGRGEVKDARWTLDAELTGSRFGAEEQAMIRAAMRASIVDERERRTKERSAKADENEGAGA